MIDVDYYEFEDGTNLIDPYLDELDPKMRAKVLRTIGLKNSVHYFECLIQNILEMGYLN